VIIGAFIAVSDIAYYDIANRLARTLRSVPLSFINAFLPAVSALDAAGDGPPFGTLYVEASRYFMLATAGLLGFLAAASAPIIDAWVGASMSPAVNVLLLLCVTYVVSNLTVVGSTMMRAVGKPRYETQYSVINAGVNVIASLILVRPFSYYGVVLGTLCGAVAGLVFSQWILHRHFGLSHNVSLHAWFWKIVAASGSAAALVWLAFRAASPVLLGHRFIELGAIALGGVAYLLLFGAILLAVRFFGDADVHRLRAVLPRRFARHLVARA
jgi:O-antigen/teichoic acid export membrane protein